MLVLLILGISSHSFVIHSFVYGLFVECCPYARLRHADIHSNKNVITLFDDCFHNLNLSDKYCGTESVCFSKKQF